MKSGYYRDWRGVQCWIWLPSVSEEERRLITNVICDMCGASGGSWSEYLKECYVDPLAHFSICKCDFFFFVVCMCTWAFWVSEVIFGCVSSISCFNMSLFGAWRKVLWSLSAFCFLMPSNAQHTIRHIYLKDHLWIQQFMKQNAGFCCVTQNKCFSTNESEKHFGSVSGQR